MNKNEVAEIKKQIKKDNGVIKDVWSCYVDGEKNKVFVQREAFGLLSEEKNDEYFNRLKKSLSGGIGRNLLNLEFPMEEEKEGGRQYDLYQLYKSELEDNAMVEAFFDKIIDCYPCNDNYFIMLSYGVYDVPGMDHNGETLEDASENVYDFILCSICPVTQTKPFLSYDMRSNGMENKYPDWQVGAPLSGFLFPSFNDRTGDIHNLLYYTSKPAIVREDFVELMFGCGKPMGLNDQKEAFSEVIMRSGTDNKPEFEAMALIHEQIAEMVTENETPDTVMIDKQIVADLLTDAGVDEVHIEEAVQTFDDHIGIGKAVPAENIMDIKKVEIKAEGVQIRVNSDYASNVETRIIEGRKAVVVFVDDPVEMNGIPVRIK